MMFWRKYWFISTTRTTEELISGLKSEIRFLREEIREKNEFLKLLSENQNNLQKATLSDTSQSHINKSKLDINESKLDINEINESIFDLDNNNFNYPARKTDVNRDVDSQLANVRKDKHKKYNEFIEVIK